MRQRTTDSASLERALRALAIFTTVVDGLRWVDTDPVGRSQQACAF
jgi:hypothetical protein